jgi:hypothetical protein
VARARADQSRADLMEYRVRLTTTARATCGSARSELDDWRIFLIANARTDLQRLAAKSPPAMIEQLVPGLATPWDGVRRVAK